MLSWRRSIERMQELKSALTNFHTIEWLMESCRCGLRQARKSALGWTGRTKPCVSQDGTTVRGLDAASCIFRIRRLTLILKSRDTVKMARSWLGSIHWTLLPRKMVAGASRCGQALTWLLLHRAIKQSHHNSIGWYVALSHMKSRIRLPRPNEGYALHAN